MVAAIWAEMGLRYPPAVACLPRNARATLASANRLCLFLPEQIPSWCLLHEMAHAMSSTQDGNSDGHGPIFVGLYVQLLARYLRLDASTLLASLRCARIAVQPDARPIFLDDAPARGAKEKTLPDKKRRPSPCSKNVIASSCGAIQSHTRNAGRDAPGLLRKGSQ
jgi:hypothetical protein